ncbi:MAG: helix-turn-helix domain-containing protein [Acidimicrobiales bacterium]
MSPRVPKAPQANESSAPRPRAREGLRQVSDTQSMRALTHPVRISLLEQLSVVGPMTATEVGELIGESPTTCSFHLRQLAKYGFVEEAGGGKGRSRPWRMTAIGMNISSNNEDPEAAIASSALAQLFRERYLQRYRTWLETKGNYPQEWRRAAGDSEFVFYLTADELDTLRDELLDFLVPRCQERLADPSLRPPGSVPVEMLVITYPMSVPERDPKPQAPVKRASRPRPSHTKEEP